MQQYRQVLSQVNFYMNQHGSRYGFILTDQELLAFRKLNNDGNLEIAASVPWSTQGTEDQPLLTILLALWYLGML